VEAMSNPLLQVADLHATVDFARKHKLVSLIDNTFATPINFRPAEHGFDISLHSCTKYMNGHSDIVSGACIGRAELIDRIRHTLNHLGGSLDPHACFLLHRGLKTMALRVRYQNQSALRIAEFFRSHPRISKVNYPGLETHPQYSLSQKLFEGFGGMMSIELKGGVEDAERFIHKAKIPICAPSLGGVETLITRPSTTSHAGVPPTERERLGISDSLIRISIGIENTDELIEDFHQALEN
ncbi:MAG: trans-sulfuration enzyme family protein, partial [Blastocatellia bacterium]